MHWENEFYPSSNYSEYSAHGSPSVGLQPSLLSDCYYYNGYSLMDTSQYNHSPDKSYSTSYYHHHPYHYSTTSNQPGICSPQTLSPNFYSPSYYSDLSYNSYKASYDSLNSSFQESSRCDYQNQMYNHSSGQSANTSTSTFQDLDYLVESIILDSNPSTIPDATRMTSPNINFEPSGDDLSEAKDNSFLSDNSTSLSPSGLQDDVGATSVESKINNEIAWFTQHKSSAKELTKKNDSSIGSFKKSLISGRRVQLDPVIRRYRQRRAANLRERKRMRSINSAFEGLRARLPHPLERTEIISSDSCNEDRHFSKVETLRYAAQYIAQLAAILAAFDAREDALEGAAYDGKPYTVTGGRKGRRNKKVFLQCHYPEQFQLSSLVHSLSWKDNRHDTLSEDKTVRARLWIPAIQT